MGVNWYTITHVLVKTFNGKFYNFICTFHYIENCSGGGNLVNSAHFKVGPLQTRPIQTISLIKVVGLNKVSRKLFNFYATFLLIKCCKETPRNSVTLYFYV